MENKLQLVKSESFGSVQADIYSNGADMFMTIDQLANCLEYSDRKGIEKLVERNPYMKNLEFSTTDRLTAVEGGRNVTRERTIFTEDGIYEVSMLSGQPKAKEFRAWIRKLLKALRAGKATITAKKSPPPSSVNNAVKIMAHGWEEAGIDPRYQVLMLTQIYRNAGLDLLDPPLTVDEPTYDLTAMAKELGVMSQASKGKEPHAQAIGAIVAMLDIPESLIVRAPFSKNGHSDDYDRYKAPVLERVRGWLEENDYPTIIHGGKNYKVAYQRVNTAA